MSKLRPCLINAKEEGLSYESTYYRVLDAVRRRRGLIHGRLDGPNDTHCAIGCYFAESRIPIDSRAIDEIAAYNDSFPELSAGTRWRKVYGWLMFQVTVLSGKGKPAEPVHRAQRTQPIKRLPAPEARAQ